ncbi:MAG: hypothetical protein KC422_18985 [Trueperaceae bacterium]|nr:hypothetical protein [Trueperaceae bacterium]
MIKGKAKRFSGNSQRAWLVSGLIIAFGLTMFLLDIAAKGWVFKLDLNLIEIIIVLLVMLYWRTSIVFDQGQLRIRQLSETVIPLETISRVSIVWNPLTGYIAAIDYLPENARRPKRRSFFASFYKEPRLFLNTLCKAIPKDAVLELCPRCKKELS